MSLNRIIPIKKWSMYNKFSGYIRIVTHVPPRSLVFETPVYKRRRK